MNSATLDEVLSSNARRKIEDALAVRPRTLRELSSVTGISVQGVLKHLKRLAALGLVEERRLPTRALKARTVYLAKGHLVGEYSVGDLTIVKPTEMLPPRASRERTPDLERMSAEVLLLQRRARDQARKLGRMIDALVDERGALRAGVESIATDGEARLILEVLLTEETLEDGLKVLSRYYGIEDRRSIDEALAAAKRSA